MRWLRAGLTTIGVCLAALGVFAWLIDHEGAIPRLEYRIDVPTVLVVLGAEVERDGSASETLETRVRHAVSTLEPGGTILVSGGVGRFGRSEASVGCAVAMSLDLEREQCLVEEASHSTLQSVAFSLRLLERQYPRGFHVIVVADPYQLPRARRLFERLGGRPVGTSPVLEAPRHLAWPERIGCAVREVPALARDLLLTAR